jgi:hypothetical protein
MWLLGETDSPVSVEKYSERWKTGLPSYGNTLRPEWSCSPDSSTYVTLTREEGPDGSDKCYWLRFVRMESYNGKACGMVMFLRLSSHPGDARVYRYNRRVSGYLPVVDSFRAEL